MRSVIAFSICLIAAATACGGGNVDEPPLESSPYSALDGQRVLLLPVQYVRRDEGPLIAGARNEYEAARQADTEIEFALKEEGSGRVTWIFPEQQVETLRQRPMFDTDVYALSAEEARQGGRGFDFVRDPLYSEIRPLVALLEARLVLLPVEVYYERDSGSRTGRVVIRTVIMDGRSSVVLHQGSIKGEDHPVTSPAALASAAQALARALP